MCLKLDCIPAVSKPFSLFTVNKFDWLINWTQFYCANFTLVLNLTPIFSVNFGEKALKVSGTAAITFVESNTFSKSKYKTSLSLTLYSLLYGQFGPASTFYWRKEVSLMFREYEIFKKFNFLVMNTGKILLYCCHEKRIVKFIWSL